MSGDLAAVIREIRQDKFSSVRDKSPRTYHSRKSSGSKDRNTDVVRSKTNKIFAMKLCKEFSDVCQNLGIKESMTREQFFSLFVSLGYFRPNEIIASPEI